jgi:hypothetical protein
MAIHFYSYDPFIANEYNLGVELVVEKDKSGVSYASLVDPDIIVIEQQKIMIYWNKGAINIALVAPNEGWTRSNIVKSVGMELYNRGELKGRPVELLSLQPRIMLPGRYNVEFQKIEMYD